MVFELRIGAIVSAFNQNTQCARFFEVFLNAHEKMSVKARSRHKIDA